MQTKGTGVKEIPITQGQVALVYDEERRTCRTCNLEKPINEYLDNGHGGRMGQCKDCQHAAAQRYADRKWIWDIPELQYCDSYGRLGEIVGLYGTMPMGKWWQVLGYHWTGCDNIAEYAGWLSSRFKRSSRLRLNMMFKEDHAGHDALPDVLTIYRGCYEDNMDGMSWTLDRAIAVRFPTLNRYRRKNQEPYLLTRTIAKRDCVYLGARDEREIVTAMPDIWLDHVHMEDISDEIADELSKCPIAGKPMKEAA
jgi:hypothetical protein